MCDAGKFNLELASCRLESRRLPVNFALARHERELQVILNERVGPGRCSAAGRTSSPHRFSTSLSRHEPAAPARWQIGHENREQCIRFLSTRLRHEPLSRALAKKIAIDSSGCTPRARTGGVAQGSKCEERCMASVAVRSFS